MWSGPRNVSTALLRSWGNRPDTVVCDEPLYAHYLQRTGAPHPGAAEVIASQSTDWRVVAQELTGPVPGDKAIYYQKHMAHHLLPEIELEWLEGLTNCFLIREPRAMLASLARVLAEPQLTDTGLPQQVDLFRREADRLGRMPPVIDAADLLRDPPEVLSRFCERVGVPFVRDMLHWPPGRRETDGVWARHWYGQVEQSTGFAPYRPQTVELPPELESLWHACQPLYDELAPYRLVAH